MVSLMKKDLKQVHTWVAKTQSPTWEDSLKWQDLKWIERNLTRYTKQHWMSKQKLKLLSKASGICSKKKIKHLRLSKTMPKRRQKCQKKKINNLTKRLLKSIWMQLWKIDAYSDRMIPFSNWTMRPLTCKVKKRSKLWQINKRWWEWAFSVMSAWVLYQVSRKPNIVHFALNQIAKIAWLRHVHTPKIIQINPTAAKSVVNAIRNFFIVMHCMKVRSSLKSEMPKNLILLKFWKVKNLNTRRVSTS